MVAFILVRPAIVSSLFLLKRGRDLPAALWVAAKRLFMLGRTMYLEWKAPSKVPLPPSLLRKPKYNAKKNNPQQEQPTADSNKGVHFDLSSETGQIRTQQYYYNPYTEAGDRGNQAELSDSQSEDRAVTDPDEMALLMIERTKIKQRIATPPPKRYQKVTLKTDAIENSLSTDKENIYLQQSQGKGKQPFMVQQQERHQRNAAKSPRTAMMTADAGATPMRAPRSRRTTNSTTSNHVRTPQPILYSSRKQPLSAQVRKRRMAGEQLFSHSPQDLSTSLEVTTQQGQPKRRRLLAGVTNPAVRRNLVALPPIRRNNKREREEQILQEFNRKREKPAPVEEKKASTLVNPQGLPINFAAGGSDTGNTRPFTFGGDKTPATAPAGAGDGNAFGFGDNNTPAAAGDSKPFASGDDKTPAPGPAAQAAAGDSRPFVFGSDKTPAPAPVAASESQPDKTKAAAPAASENKPFVFGASVNTAAPTGKSKLFVFGNNDNAATTTPGASIGDKNPVVVGNGDNTAAPATTTPAAPTGNSKPFAFGTNQSDTPGANKTTSSMSGMVFGANNTTGGNTTEPVPVFSFDGTSATTPTTSTPAPSLGFSGGGNDSAAKPDPPTMGTGGTTTAQPSFAFGSTASNTPAAGGGFGNTTPAPALRFGAPVPTPGFGTNNTSASTPGFVAPGFGGATPVPATGGFGATTTGFGSTASTPGLGAPATGGFGGMAPAPDGFGSTPVQLPAFGASNVGGFSSAPSIPAAGSAFATGVAPAGGASARRRSMNRSRRRA